MAFELAYSAVEGTNGAVRAANIPWDSELFGFPFYEAVVDPPLSGDSLCGFAAWLTGLDAQARTLVWSKIDSAKTDTLESLSSLGFYPVEVAMALTGQLARVKQVVPPNRMVGRLRSATPGDVKRLEEIAIAAFWADRFHLDANLSSPLADERYARWIRRAVEDGERVFAFEDVRDGAVIGFTQYRPSAPGVVDLTLTAVDPAVKLPGAGAMLFQSLMERCASEGYVTAVSRVSGCNLAVLNLFVQLGFTFRSVAVTLHRFTPGTDSPA